MLFGANSVCTLHKLFYFIIDSHFKYLPTRREKGQDSLDGKVASNSDQDWTVND